MQVRSSKCQCGYCGSESGDALYATEDLKGQIYSICKCRQCRFFYLSPIPTAEELASAYDDSYYGQSETKFPRYIEGILDFFRKGRSRRVRKYVPAPARILDIGCGNGRFLGYLIPQGYQAFGIELSGKSAERAVAISGLELSTEPLSEGMFGPDFFDAISLWHVFEHLTQPKQTLEIIDSILKPGGYLFLSLPNIESWQSRLFKGKWLHLDPPKHLIFPGFDTLVSELDKRGFDWVDKTFFSIEQNPFGMQQSLLNCLNHKREILFEALKGNTEYLKDVSGISILSQKLFYMLTFPFFIVLALAEAIVKKGGTMEIVFRKRQ